jgi:RecB family exonuclease
MENNTEPTFLQRCAQHILAANGKLKLHNVCIVLPSRRGVFYLKKYLKLAVNEAFIMPKVLSVEDYVLETAGLQIASTVELYLHLYQAASQHNAATKFEQFISWAPTILGDFDLIDQYLVDARELFAYMTEAKAIERWGLSGSQQSGSATDKYYELYKTLHNTYQTFNTILQQQNLSYRGAAYRFLAQNIHQLVLDKPSYEQYYFVGFNALSLAEENIIFAMQKAGIAQCLWHTDSYYMSNNPAGEQAGRFLKNYKNRGGTWLWTQQQLLQQAKNIKIIETANASQQAWVAAHFLEKWYAQQPNTQPETALVLADENLLSTVIHQIPATVPTVNYTMGLGFKYSQLYLLLDTAFAIQNTAVTTHPSGQVCYSKKLIMRLLGNSLLADMLAKDSHQLAQFLSKKQSSWGLLIPQSQLCEQLPQLQNLLLFWENNPSKAIDALLLFTKKLQSYIANGSNQLEGFFLEEFEKIALKTQILLSQNTQINTVAALQSLLKELLKAAKLPFQTERESSLQVMGMLESRTLDFERVILLSANENVLPASKKSASLIPFDALHLFGMPSYSQQDSIMAYHFFRLLQHAKEIVICHVSTKAGYGANEASRFLLQIEKHLAPQNPQIQLEKLKIKTDTTTITAPITANYVQKTDAMMLALQTWLAQKGLSATSLNTYMACGMKFYLERIAKLVPANDETNTMGYDTFGEIVHTCLQYLYQSLGEQPYDSQHIALLKHTATQQLQLAINASNTKATNKINVQEGTNLILVEVARSLIQKYLDFEEKNTSRPKQNFAIEDDFETQISLKTEHQGTILIKATGKCDRIELCDHDLTVIDYKTGKVEAKDLAIKKNSSTHELEQQLLLPERDKLRQLWFYKFILEHQLANKGHVHTVKGKKISNITSIVAGIYSFRNAEFKLHTANIQPADGQSFIGFSEQVLANIVNQMLDIHTPFARTENTKICEYCNYKKTCGR